MAKQFKKALVYLPLLAVCGCVGIWLYNTGATIAEVKVGQETIGDKVKALAVDVEKQIERLDLQGTTKFHTYQLEFVGVQKDIQTIQIYQAEMKQDFIDLREKMDNNQQQVLEAIKSLKD